MNRDLWRGSNIVLITCEVSMDPETAIEIGTEWGISHFEIRQLWETRIPFISDAQRRRLARTARNYGASIVAISPGLFIGAEAAPDAAQEELAKKLPLSLRFAEEFGCGYIIVFSFKRTPGVGEDWVAARLREAADLAQAKGVTLVLEPLPGHYGDNGESVAGIVRAVARDNFRVNWDPGNVAAAGYAPYPDGYEHVRGLVGYLHLKDWAGSQERPWTVLGEGSIDWPGQLRALAQDGYAGPLSIETHTRYNEEFQPIIAASRANLAVLRRWLQESA